MLRTPIASHIVKLFIVTLLLLVASAGNVLAQGVQASTAGAYAGLPGRGGRLITPRSVRRPPADRAARRLIITTPEAAARAASDVDSQGSNDPPASGHTVVLTETHTEGRLHAVAVHPEDLEASRPVHPGPTHHERGAPPGHDA